MAVKTITFVRNSRELEMKKENWKNREGVVYSTASNFSYEYSDDAEAETLAPNQQTLKVMLDKKQRAGKAVTLVDGFVGTDDDLKTLGKRLKQACGVGGTCKDGQILVQGDFRDKIIGILQNEGYRVKRVGG